ncbi:hypothetical protein [Nocardia otitidiscaviarum]|uniref:hypothetical protein n=1 Tax=Nocardia otitidiscaviarum TaxID=1823 RepID=UPI002456114B|nr:hypothetical protein [Nocardia otitidiscaviarum]
MNDVAALVDLLRRLAGRLPDADLATLRSLLAARELEDLERSLIHKISYYGIELTPPERAILPGVDAGPMPGRTVPTPRFAAADPDGSPAENDLLNRAVGRPGLRRIVKARRLPGAERVLYVVVCAAGTDVSRLQNALEVDALVEVVAEDEQLPPYQAAALAAGRQLWPTDPHLR